MRKYLFRQEITAGIDYTKKESIKNNHIEFLKGEYHADEIIIYRFKFNSHFGVKWDHSQYDCLAAFDKTNISNGIR